MKLTNSSVVFEPDAHTYTLNGQSLSGITSILSKYLFTDKYADVPKAILDKAAEHGTQVHEQIQCIIEGFDPQECLTEAIAYKQFVADTNMNVIASEYVVSDNESVASAIDIVSEYEDGVQLIDIKTTSTLDKEYLAWQLSIYAYLFELCNPTIKVKDLAGLHLRADKAQLVHIDRLSDEHVKALLSAYRSGADTFTNPLKVISTDEERMLAEARNVEQALINLKEQADYYANLQELIKEKLMDEMTKRGIMKWESDGMVITRKEATTRKSVDSKALQADYPDVYANVLKESQVKGSITIKLK